MPEVGIGAKGRVVHVRRLFKAPQPRCQCACLSYGAAPCMGYTWSSVRQEDGKVIGTHCTCPTTLTPFTPSLTYALLYAHLWGSLWQLEIAAAEGASSCLAAFGCFPSFRFPVCKVCAPLAVFAGICAAGSAQPAGTWLASAATGRFAAGLALSGGLSASLLRFIALSFLVAVCSAMADTMGWVANRTASAGSCTDDSHVCTEVGTLEQLLS